MAGNRKCAENCKTDTIECVMNLAAEVGPERMTRAFIMG